MLGFRILGFRKLGGLGVGFGWVFVRVWARVVVGLGGGLCWVLEPKSSVPVRFGSLFRSLSCCLNILFIICCILFTFFPVGCC